MKVRKLRFLQNISWTLNGDAMHDDTQNKEKDEKHAQGNERGESLKACAQ